MKIKRTKKPNPKYADTFSFALIAFDLANYEEAAEQVRWQGAMMEEIHAIERNSTWELVCALD